MKKAMELSILCGSEVGLVVIFENKLHVYASSDFESLIRRYHEYEGSYESLDNSDHESLQPGRASSFKIHHQKMKIRSTPCQYCGCYQASAGTTAESGSQNMQSGMPSASSGQSMQSGMPSASSVSSNYGEFALAQAMNSGDNYRPPSKRQRLETGGGVRQDMKYSKIPASPRFRYSSQQIPPHLQGNGNYKLSNGTSESNMNDGKLRRGSLMAKRGFNARPVELPIKQNPSILQSFSESSSTMFPGTTAAGMGDRSAGLMSSTVLPSPSTFLIETPRDGPPSSAMSSMNMPAIPSLSPFGWGTPTSKGSKKSFSKMPGHPDSQSSNSAVTTGTVATLETSNGSNGTFEVGSVGAKSKSMGGLWARRAMRKGAGSLSQRRGARLNSLDLSSLRKPNPKVVEVSSDQGKAEAGDNPRYNPSLPPPSVPRANPNSLARNPPIEKSNSAYEAPNSGLLTPSLLMTPFSPDRDRGNMSNGMLFRSPWEKRSGNKVGSDMTGGGNEPVEAEGLHAMVAALPMAGDL